MTSDETTKERERALIEADAPLRYAEIMRNFEIADYSARKLLTGRRYMRPSELRAALDQLRAG